MTLQDLNPIGRPTFPRLLVTGLAIWFFMLLFTTVTSMPYQSTTGISLGAYPLDHAPHYARIDLAAFVVQVFVVTLTAPLLAAFVYGTWSLGWRLYHPTKSSPSPTVSPAPLPPSPRSPAGGP